jgi:hypothetical protein
MVMDNLERRRELKLLQARGQVEAVLRDPYHRTHQPLSGCPRQAQQWPRSISAQSPSRLLCRACRLCGDVARLASPLAREPRGAGTRGGR